MNTVVPKELINGFNQSDNEFLFLTENKKVAVIRYNKNAKIFAIKTDIFENNEIFKTEEFKDVFKDEKICLNLKNVEIVENANKETEIIINTLDSDKIKSVKISQDKVILNLDGSEVISKDIDLKLNLPKDFFKYAETNSVKIDYLPKTIFKNIEALNFGLNKVPNVEIKSLELSKRNLQLVKFGKEAYLANISEGNKLDKINEILKENVSDNGKISSNMILKTDSTNEIKFNKTSEKENKEILKFVDDTKVQASLSLNKEDREIESQASSGNVINSTEETQLTEQDLKEKRKYISKILKMLNDFNIQEGLKKDYITEFEKIANKGKLDQDAKNKIVYKGIEINRDNNVDIDLRDRIISEVERILDEKDAQTSSTVQASAEQTQSEASVTADNSVNVGATIENIPEETTNKPEKKLTKSEIYEKELKDYNEIVKKIKDDYEQKVADYNRKEYENYQMGGGFIYQENEKPPVEPINPNAPVKKGLETKLYDFNTKQSTIKKCEIYIDKEKNEMFLQTTPGEFIRVDGIYEFPNDKNIGKKDLAICQKIQEKVAEAESKESYVIIKEIKNIDQLSLELGKFKQDTEEFGKQKGISNFYNNFQSRQPMNDVQKMEFSKIKKRDSKTHLEGFKEEDLDKVEEQIDISTQSLTPDVSTAILNDDRVRDLSAATFSIPVYEDAEDNKRKKIGEKVTRYGTESNVFEYGTNLVPDSQQPLMKVSILSNPDGSYSKTLEINNYNAEFNNLKSAGIENNGIITVELEDFEYAPNSEISASLKKVIKIDGKEYTSIDILAKDIVLTGKDRSILPVYSAEGEKFIDQKIPANFYELFSKSIIKSEKLPSQQLAGLFNLNKEDLPIGVESVRKYRLGGKDIEFLVLNKTGEDKKWLFLRTGTEVQEVEGIYKIPVKDPLENNEDKFNLFFSCNLGKTGKRASSENKIVHEILNVNQNSAEFKRFTDDIIKNSNEIENELNPEGKIDIKYHDHWDEKQVTEPKPITKRNKIINRRIKTKESVIEDKPAPSDPKQPSLKEPTKKKKRKISKIFKYLVYGILMAGFAVLGIASSILGFSLLITFTFFALSLASCFSFGKFVVAQMKSKALAQQKRIIKESGQSVEKAKEDKISEKAQVKDNEAKEAISQIKKELENENQKAQDLDRENEELQNKVKESLAEAELLSEAQQRILDDEEKKKKELQNKKMAEMREKKKKNRTKKPPSAEQGLGM